MRLLRLITLCGCLAAACDTGGEPSEASGAADGSAGSTTTTGADTSSDTSAKTGGATQAGTHDGSTGPETSGSTTAASGDTTSAGDTGTSGDSTGSSSCNNGSLDAGEVDVDCGGECGACPTGSVCENPADCESTVCESGSCLGTAEGCELDAVQGPPGGLGWADSYSVDGRCYCATSFDHNIGDITVDTPAGPRTVMEVCNAIGPGPGLEDHPIYNDVQCGNGPANDAGDEDWCPGRVDQGEAGCCTAGPRWDLSVFEP